MQFSVLLDKTFSIDEFRLGIGEFGLLWLGMGDFG